MELDDFLDAAADSGERQAYAAGAADAEAELRNPNSGAAKEVEVEAALARALARERAEIVGALYALLDAAEADGGSMGTLRESTDTLAKQLAELEVDLEAFEGVMASAEADDALRFHCRRVVSKIEVVSARQQSLKYLTSSTPFRTIGGLAAERPAEGTIEW